MLPFLEEIYIIYSSMLQAQRKDLYFQSGGYFLLPVKVLFSVLNQTNTTFREKMEMLKKKKKKGLQFEL